MNIINIQPTWRNSDEHKACTLGNPQCVISETLQKNAIGIGSVEYIRNTFPWSACNPYPPWLPWGRKIYFPGNFIDKPLFYKPADIPKRFKSKILDIPPEGKWIASDPVNFIAEWRAYVVKGEVLAIFCYSDFDFDYSPPFPWPIPYYVTAAIDFGLTNDRKILPIEVNDPYSIGWYGSLSQFKIYTYFVIQGWKYMLSKFSNIPI